MKYSDKKKIERQEQLKKMKKESYFVTTSRGSIHNEDDLYNTLIEGHLAGAGLDVWEF